MAYRDTVLTDTPIDFYEMESSTGTDSGSGARTLTLSGGITTGVSGRPGNGWQFDGVNDSAATASFPTLTSNFSLEVWVKSDSNGSWSNDYNTFIRRDGTDIVLIRGRGSNITGNVQPGKAEVYLAGSTIYSTNRIDDGNWHHLVLTVAGTSAILYVDGVSAGTVTTTKSTYSFGTGAAYLGSAAGTGEFFKGVMDNAAIYNSTLSSTRVSAHYSANPAPVNGGYTAQAATASATMPGGVVQKVVNVAAPAATANGVMPDAKPAVKVKNVNTLQINGLSESASSSVQNANADLNTTMELDSSTSSRNRVLLSGDFGLPLDAAIGNAELQVNLLFTGSITFRVHSVDAPFDPTIVTWANQPATGSIMSTSKTFTTSGYKTFDVTDIVKAMAAGTVYGLELVASAGSNYVTTGLGGNADAPTLVITYASDGNANVAVTPLTGSAVMVDPAFSNVTNKTVNASVATASALALDPSVTLVRNVGIAAEPATATAVMGAGSGFNSPVVVPADVATASGQALDASVTVERNAVVSVPAMSATAVLAAPLEAQNASDDPYYNWIAMTTDSDDYWYRMDETSGTTLSPKSGKAEDVADLYGTYSFGVYGPESRKAIHFENGYAQPRAMRYMPDDQRTADSQGGVHAISGEMTFEIVMRTTDKNGILAYGLDNYYQAAVFRNAIFLKNGRVSINSGRLDVPGVYELSGFKDVADGQWHHIVVTQGGGNPKALDNGLRIYIDGKLDIRRNLEGSLWAAPDSYMGMPQVWRDITPFYPWVDNLTADVMEVVYRLNSDITQDTAIELYYASMGIKPVRVEAATGSAFMPEAKGKGNQKRVLVLYTDRITFGTGANLIGDERNSPTSFDTKTPDEFDHDIQIGRIYEPGESPWIDLAGFRVVAVPIMREEGNPLAGPYRDVVTDLPRLINLQDDLSLDEIDLIMFRNWPDEGGELENFRVRGYDNDAIEDFLASVKQAVVDGKGLEVTNVNLAFRLGLISGAQPIPMLYDKKAGGFGETDLRGDAVSPFPAGGDILLDLHANNWHRVTAQVPNLTDIDSEYISEAFTTYNDGLDGRVTNNWGYKLEDGPLTIGKEILDPVVFWNRIKTYTQEGVPTEWVWDKAVWAVTPNGLLAGTPVYKFNNKMWTGNTEVDNPYKDFIGGAVVQPGDVWGGVRIAGKVFMNFAEAPIAATRMGAMTRQIVPPNSQLANPNDHETAEMREWDYSYSRILFSASGGGKSTNQEFELVQGADGSLTYRLIGGKGGAVVGINISEKYDTENVIVLSWAMRGLAWLANTESAPVGSVIIRPTAITGSGSMPQPAVLAQRDALVNAEAAIGRGALVNPAEVEDPDVTIYPFPARGSGEMTGYGKTISVEPFEGSGELVDNFELVSARGEQAIVFLYTVPSEVNVYLMEGSK